MERDGHENVIFFYGKEVEHTPQYGKYTMFVVGVQSVEDIAMNLTMGREKVEHIYFGANMSFPNLALTDHEAWREWENMIVYFLDKGYQCTLDIDVSCVEGLAEGLLVEHRNFNPMISVKLPYIHQLGYNATIKLDDIDFDKTNNGVWCHSVHNLMSRESFTDWDEYSKDETV
jgi:hypothetical protein